MVWNKEKERGDRESRGRGGEKRLRVKYGDSDQERGIRGERARIVLREE